jgi:hypothetical protein
VSAFRRASILLAAATTATAILGPAGPASAERLALTDPTNDVWAVDITGSGDGNFVPADPPTQVNTDLTQTSFRHGPGKLIVRATFDDLRRVGGGYEFGFNLRTNAKVHRFAYIDAGPGHWRGQLFVGRPNGDKVKCAGKSREIDYEQNTVTISVPRFCANKPRWVQFNAAAFSIDDGETHIYTDNPHNEEAQFNGWSDRIRRG